MPLSMMQQQETTPGFMQPGIPPSGYGLSGNLPSATPSSMPQQQQENPFAPGPSAMPSGVALENPSLQHEGISKSILLKSIPPEILSGNTNGQLQSGIPIIGSSALLPVPGQIGKDTISSNDPQGVFLSSAPSFTLPEVLVNNDTQRNFIPSANPVPPAIVIQPTQGDGNLMQGSSDPGPLPFDQSVIIPGNSFNLIGSVLGVQQVQEEASNTSTGPVPNLFRNPIPPSFTIHPLPEKGRENDTSKETLNKCPIIETSSIVQESISKPIETIWQLPKIEDDKPNNMTVPAPPTHANPKPPTMVIHPVDIENAIAPEETKSNLPSIDVSSILPGSAALQDVPSILWGIQPIDDGPPEALNVLAPSAGAAPSPPRLVIQHPPPELSSPILQPESESPSPGPDSVVPELVAKQIGDIWETPKIVNTNETGALESISVLQPNPTPPKIKIKIPSKLDPEPLQTNTTDFLRADNSLIVSDILVKQEEATVWMTQTIKDDKISAHDEIPNPKQENPKILPYIIIPKHDNDNKSTPSHQSPLLSINHAVVFPMEVVKEANTIVEIPLQENSEVVSASASIPIIQANPTAPKIAINHNSKKGHDFLHDPSHNGDPDMPIAEISSIIPELVSNQEAKIWGMQAIQDNRIDKNLQIAPSEKQNPRSPELTVRHKQPAESGDNQTITRESEFASTESEIPVRVTKSNGTIWNAPDMSVDLLEVGQTSSTQAEPNSEKNLNSTPLWSIDTCSVHKIHLGKVNNADSDLHAPKQSLTLPPLEFPFHEDKTKDDKHETPLPGLIKASSNLSKFLIGTEQSEDSNSPHQSNLKPPSANGGNFMDMVNNDKSNSSGGLEDAISQSYACPTVLVNTEPAFKNDSRPKITMEDVYAASKTTWKKEDNNPTFKQEPTLAALKKSDWKFQVSDPESEISSQRGSADKTGCDLMKSEHQDSHSWREFNNVEKVNGADRKSQNLACYEQTATSSLPSELPAESKNQIKHVLQPREFAIENSESLQSIPDKCEILTLTILYIAMFLFGSSVDVWSTLIGLLLSLIL
ncbi:hypothetical protein SCHPADRAFT_886147 [Schizopora paradoxa]|uniref:Uncharacterized protein n=1 Tax=Schizopora paradoxa TaxID=27342 RepID=A0A0H2SAA9_9AGAM|nr:hypothetical protein SCHPADRAFT_886147 [Schizopora paradoxa]